MGNQKEENIISTPEMNIWFKDIIEYAGNWTEDYPHENGNYHNVCIRCTKTFIGYKRRMHCKLCVQKVVDEQNNSEK